MRKYFQVLVLSLGGLLVMGSAAAASSSGTGVVSQSYGADSSVLPGMIVEAKANSPGTVEPLASQDIRNMFGVVVPANDAPIVLTPTKTAAQQVLVATSGSYELLVSNQNGAIKAGDYITVSSLAGIGMKADIDEQEIVGQAAGNFNGTGNVVGSAAVKGSLGHTTTVTIGQLPVNIHLAPNPLFQKNVDSLPGFLNRLADDAASQPVKSARVALSAIVLAASFLITAVIFYGSLRTSMSAIGRNPLARRAIGRNTAWAILSGLVIFGVGILASYLIVSL